MPHILDKSIIGRALTWTFSGDIDFYSLNFGEFPICSVVWFVFNEKKERRFNPQIQYDIVHMPLEMSPCPSLSKSS